MKFDQRDLDFNWLYHVFAIYHAINYKIEE